MKVGGFENCAWHENFQNSRYKKRRIEFWSHAERWKWWGRPWEGMTRHVGWCHTAPLREIEKASEMARRGGISRSTRGRWYTCSWVTFDGCHASVTSCRTLIFDSLFLFISVCFSLPSCFLLMSESLSLFLRPFSLLINLRASLLIFRRSPNQIYVIFVPHNVGA